MIERNIQLFTDKEEECISFLTRTGNRNAAARILVYLMNVPEATPREIERGTLLRQPEVSRALKALVGEGWVRARATSVRKTRPYLLYALAMPMSGIIDGIEKKIEREADRQMALIHKMRTFV